MKLIGTRSLLGAAAMVIVGIVVSMMANHYFTSGTGEEALTTSRWWWEIVLNLQILCAAFIWFAHTEQVKSATGWRHAVTLLQMLSSLMAVLLPIWIALFAITLGWFEVRPGLEIINQAFFLCLGLWVSARILIWAIKCWGKKRLLLPKHIEEGRWHLVLLGVSPLIAVLVLTAVEMSRGGFQHYIYAPFLLYIQAAVPYLQVSFRLEKT